MTSTDYGKDEDSVQSLFKKLEGVERDLCGFTSTVENLKKLSKGLVERHHFDSKNIAYKQSEIEHKFEDLQNLKEKRSQRLLESEKYHRFIMQADQVIEWIGDQTTVSTLSYIKTQNKLGFKILCFFLSSLTCINCFEIADRCVRRLWLRR